jgi:hypothetical protein
MRKTSSASSLRLAIRAGSQKRRNTTYYRSRLGFFGRTRVASAFRPDRSARRSGGGARWERSHSARHSPQRDELRSLPGRDCTWWNCGSAGRDRRRIASMTIGRDSPQWLQAECRTYHRQPAWRSIIPASSGEAFCRLDKSGPTNLLAKSGRHRERLATIQSGGSVNAVKLVEVGEYGGQPTSYHTTMLVEKSEDIVGPDSRSKVTERMAVLRSAPIAGINLQFVRFPRVLHRRG